MHKLNRFHFHLTDDQGWRIEIKKYPDLARVGSVRRRRSWAICVLRPNTTDSLRRVLYAETRFARSCAMPPNAISR
ncbi:MAG: family 20 glycosylhydrolase [Alistipes shahii]